MSELREVLLNAVAEIPHAERFHTEVVNKILALSEMKELREKAEKWDRINESTGGELQNLFTWIRSLESNLSTIMQDLVVEESRLKREWGGIESIGEPEYVTDTRPATAGEVREVIVWIFSDLDVGNKILADNKGWYFLLKNGRRLRLEK